jgi:apolipoprotein D and lipocalin family protein
MKSLLSIIAIFILFNLSPASASDKTDPEVVPNVNFERYTGLWYDIAHSPNFFQRNCVRSTAEYSVLTTLSVSVKNTCYKADGSTSDIEGEAKVVDAKVPAKLKVRFNFFARGDYWIVDLDPSYQWAVVSGPQKKSLFILSRQAPMSNQLLNEIIDRLKKRGFKTDDLVLGQY